MLVKQKTFLTCIIFAVPSLFSQALLALEYKNSFGSIDAGYCENFNLSDWKFYPRWKAAITWRYFKNKLGYDGFGDQMIYMLGYEF